MWKELDIIRGKKFVGVAELTEQTARIVEQIAPVQERGTVSEVPDERTIRYYLAEGLLSPAEEKQGTSSVFGYRHLLQLLAVKKLQAENFPIRKIRELVFERKERDLERLLGIGTEAVGARNEAIRYLEGLLTQPARTAPAPQPPTFVASSDQSSNAAGGLNAAPAMMMRYERGPRQESSTGPLAIEAGVDSGSLPPFSIDAGRWDRIVIEPGLELQLRSDYKAPAEGKALRRLARLILEVIESHPKLSANGGS